EHQAVGDGARGTHQKSIAIWRGMSDECRGYHGPGTRSIFDNDCLSQPFADALGCKSRDQVIRATRPKPHHPSDGTIRPIRPCRWRTNKPNKQAGGVTQEPASHSRHLLDASKLISNASGSSSFHRRLASYVMSAFEPKMSALAPRADMCSARADICYGPIVVI